MSQINVDIIQPFTPGTDVVDVNGVRVLGSISTSSIQVSSSYSATTSQDSVLIGFGAAPSVTGQSTVAIGKYAGLSLTTGYTNVLVGQSAGQNMSVGLGNTLIGHNSGTQVNGSGNVALGSSSAVLLTTGSSNTFIGSQTGSGVGPISGGFNTVIGYGANPSTGTVYNEFTLGSSSVATLRCAVTSITSLSDARDKKEVEDLNVGLEFIDGLRPVKFVWDDRDENGKHDIADFGFIAQDLKAAEEAVEMADILKLVYDENPEKLEASYGKLIPVLVKAVQELSAEVKELKSK
jgi:hypothetical protein